VNSTEAGREGPVTLIVQMRAKAGCADRVEAELTAQLRRIREREEACTTIAGNRHAEDPDRFLLYEIWRSRAEFDAFYQGLPATQEYLARMGELVAEGDLTAWEAIA
jgi:quinol monooxygenase YgiN